MKSTKKKERLELHPVYPQDGCMKGQWTDQDGCAWVENWTGGTIDENECDECGEQVSTTFVCLDGGEGLCEDCLEKKYDVVWCDYDEDWNLEHHV